MNCKKCDSKLVSSLEVRCEYCSECIPGRLKDDDAEADLRGIIEHHRRAIELLEENLRKSLDVRGRRIELEACFEGGKEAFARDFPIEQDPHEEGSDESAMWQNGWVEAARLKEAEEMREFIRWDFEMWTHIHELIVNGCDAEELRVKSTLAPVKAMKFLPELLSG